MRKSLGVATVPLTVPVLLNLCLLVGAASGQVQVEPPQDKELFTEDLRNVRKAQQQKVRQALQTDTPTGTDIDVKAPSVSFDQERQVVVGSGGVLISGPGGRAQAESASVNLETKEAELQDRVLFTTGEGTISARAAQVNLDRETGSFAGAEFRLEEGNYGIAADAAEKLSEIEYQLEDASLSTCQCLEPEQEEQEGQEKAAPPWQLRCRRAHITQEGYAHTYDTRMEVLGVPLFYTPWLAFPVKQERTSGLLVPTWGYSGEDGLQLKLPLFMVLDDQTDLTLTPFIETETRRGAALDFREAFSLNNNASARFLYSDESPRDGDLRGTVVDGLADPELDEEGRFDEENRYGGFYKQLWRTPGGAAVPASFISDVRYVSDDLFLRELDDEPGIGNREDLFVTSTVALRANPVDFVSTELSGEYNQSVSETPDDEVLQRLPEFTASALRSFRPFGFNSYGAKVVTSVRAQAVEFQRDLGYDGFRGYVNPGVSVPFHYKNYFNSSVDVGMYQTVYDLDDRLDLDTGEEIDGSQDRQVWRFRYSVGTALERVYGLEPGNWLSTLTGYGSRNQDLSLARLKHTIEPLVSYTYVPDSSQDDLPLFDSYDRMRERSLFRYGVKTSLYGRFLPRHAGPERIQEVTPRIEDLPGLATVRPFSEYGIPEPLGFGAEGSSLRQGEVRELATFGVFQTYDYKEDTEDNDPDRLGFSDLNAMVGVYPTSYFGLMADTNYGLEQSDVSSWSLMTHLKDDRGDAVRARYTYVEEEVSQIEGHLELQLTDRYRLGYYSRYDELESEFIESAVALRILSACNCWHVDLGFSDRINPDREQVSLRFTFTGLGDITQDIVTFRGQE